MWHSDVYANEINNWQQINNLSFLLSYQIVVTKVSVTKLLVTKLSLLFNYQIVSYQIVSHQIVSYQIGVTKNPPAVVGLKKVVHLVTLLLVH